MSNNPAEDDENITTNNRLDIFEPILQNNNNIVNFVNYEPIEPLTENNTLLDSYFEDTVNSLEGESLEDSIRRINETDITLEEINNILSF